MPIPVTAVKLFKTTGGLGGGITATEATSGISGNVFDAFSGAETAAGGTFYACLYIKNEDSTRTASTVEAFIDSETAHDGVNVSITKGTSAVNADEQTITDENTAPTGVTFADTDTTTTGDATADVSVSLPDLAPNDTVAIWVRMVIDAATAAKTGYVANVKINFDSPE